MKDKYLIIKKDGKIEEIKVGFNKNKYPKDFRLFIEREALKKSAERGMGSSKSNYLAVASRFGFSWEKNADVGLVNYNYKADLIMRLVKEYARQLVKKIGFPIYEIRGSNIFDMSYPVVGAYAKLYGDRLYQFKSGKKEVVMSYDASYPQFNLAIQSNLSYKNLPFGHFSISDCYRHEQSGECMLFYRQRRFFMPDLHPYFRNIKEAFDWYPKIEKQLLAGVKEAKREYHIVIEVSSEENWDKYRKQIVGVAKNLKKDVLVGILSGGKDKYWIINVDYKIVDKLEQSREICCIQVDVGNAKRLGIEYIDNDAKKKNPIIIHSAVPGGIERYIYMLIDGFPESFPLWLYPSQIRLIPVNQSFVPYCQKLIRRYDDLPLRIEIDDRAESVSKKIKESHNDLIPFSVVIGKKEISAPKIKELENAVNKIVKSGKEKPFIELSYPNLLSQQI